MGQNLPPMDLDAERAVISASMLTPDALAECQSVLEADHFATSAHQAIWRVMCLLEAENSPADLVTVAGKLRDQGRLDSVGGAHYLAQIVEASPAVAHIRDHAMLVRDKWRLRQMIEVNRRAVAEAHGDVGSVDRFLADHAAELDSVLQTKSTDTVTTFRVVAQRESESFFERKNLGGKIPGIPTGLRDLDEMIGGLKRGNYYLLAARPGMGKTGLALQIAIHAAKMGFGVVFISMEMPAEQVMQRAIAQEARLDIKAIERGTLTPDERDLYMAAVRKMAKLPIAIDEAASHTVASVRAAVRRAQAKLRADHPGANVSLVEIDYIQQMRPAKESSRSRDSELSDLSNGCRMMAKEFNAPVLALSQLNRDVEKRPDKRPLMSDVRESGALEQDAFGILMLYREDYYRNDPSRDDGLAEILVRKLRQGGATGTVTTSFHGPSTKFFDVAKDDHYAWLDE